MSYRISIVLYVIVHIVALLSLGVLLWDLWFGRLGANPIREVQLRTGKAAITLLLASLAPTPLYTLSGWRPLLGLRRMLGLYAFAYVCLHFINFLAIDYGFNFGLIRQDLLAKRYAVAGLVAFLILLPLAVTSTQRWVARLGRNWSRLHRLLYLAAVIAVVHFIWQTKADFRQPVTYAGILGLLLLLRLPPVRSFFVHRLPWRC